MSDYMWKHYLAMLAAANDNEKPAPDPFGRKTDAVHVAPECVLSHLVYFSRLSIATANLGMSRRKFADDIATTLFFFEGDMLWPDGTPLYLSDTCLDDAFGDDGSFRWLSEFIKRAHQPIQRRPQNRVIERLRLIDLYFKIKHPVLARHFCR